jgi:hypothetical protein
VAYAASLYPDTYLFLTRPDDRLLDEAKSPGLGYLDRLICFSHFRLLSIWKNSCVIVHKNSRTSGRLKIRRRSRSWLNYASFIVLEFSILVLIENAAVWRFCSAFVGGKRE